MQSQEAVAMEATADQRALEEPTATTSPLALARTPYAEPCSAHKPAAAKDGSMLCMLELHAPSPRRAAADDLEMCT